MFNRIKNKIDTELKKFIRERNKNYSLARISPYLSANIKDFVLRKGKRIRPALFIIGYLGFAKKPAPGLYRSALALELLHDFFLIHDDIIDKSDTRRGKPSMHAMLNNSLSEFKKIKFNGSDLAIVTGDVISAMAIDAFLSIKEKMERKEAALKKFIESVIFTGGGEFIELLFGIKNLEKIKKTDIYKIYDFKTAYYSFSYPLSIGAVLSGAGKKETEKLFKYGVSLGRAFQINDDILGMFAEEKETGKSNITDLKEAKKTILIWYAYNNSSQKNKKVIKRIMEKENINTPELITTRKIIIESGALEQAKKEISFLSKNAQSIALKLSMRKQYKDTLYNYPQELFKA